MPNLQAPPVRRVRAGDTRNSNKMKLPPPLERVAPKVNRDADKYKRRIK